ncbi:hypothetical protein [Dactylosporangium sp. NPDC051541]|uniref:hypothetical protein n=1 Tax=Dactylosporangium sp. NPDC051541 TaxID=3363977 RepID=UPI0037AF2B5D
MPKERADQDGDDPLRAPEASRHRKVLKQAGLISTSRRGRYRSHALDIPATATLGADLLAAFLR